MDEKPILKYFTGGEADQFTFYRIPKQLFTNRYFRNLSTDAKVLYNLMLDRISLSVKNHWIDEQNRVYIYFSVEDTMEYLNCRKNKAVQLLSELDSEKGIGLIEKRRQGQGKPTVIYVKNFFIPTDAGKAQKKSSEELPEPASEVGKTNFKKSEKQTSGSLKNKPLEVGKRDTNNTKFNNTEYNNLNLILSEDSDERLDEYTAYSEIIKENMEMDILYERYPFDGELLDGIYDLILETVLCKGGSVVIARNEYPVQLVKSKFLKLNSMHIEYVLNCMKSNTSKVRNIKKYLLAALFNAPTTISGYYQAEVNHDMPQFVKMY